MLINRTFWVLCQPLPGTFIFNIPPLWFIINFNYVKHMKNLLYIVCMVCALNSCNMDEKITWEVQQHPEMLVVESIITNEVKQQAIHITLSNPYFDSNTPKSVTGANVVVNDGDNSFQFAESKEMPGWYFSEQVFAGVPLRTYHLSIQLASGVNGLTEYTAQSEFPKGLTMDSIKCEIYKMPDMNNGETKNNEEKDTTILDIYYFGKEPENAENFYFAKEYRNGKLLYTNPKEYTYYSVASQNESYTHLVGVYKNIASNDTITYQLYTIGRDYYKYLEAIQNMDSSGDAYSMSGPPANAIGNVEGGKALGYFLTAFVSEKKALAVDKR